ncbi:MAG: hypothetical protein NC911_06180 [Candidatus Omnitrophica bacterium]|nr:hypothetical protein [Candidatus Omnitrophota bacterium]
MDLFGVVVVATITAVGGGTLSVSLAVFRNQFSFRLLPLA